MSCPDFVTGVDLVSADRWVLQADADIQPIYNLHTLLPHAAVLPVGVFVAFGAAEPATYDGGYCWGLQG